MNLVGHVSMRHVHAAQLRWEKMCRGFMPSCGVLSDNEVPTVVVELPHVPCPEEMVPWAALLAERAYVCHPTLDLLACWMRHLHLFNANTIVVRACLAWMWHHALRMLHAWHFNTHAKV